MLTYLSWLRLTDDLGLFFLLSALVLSFIEAEGKWIDAETTGQYSKCLLSYTLTKHFNNNYFVCPLERKQILTLDFLLLYSEGTEPGSQI